MHLVFVYNAMSYTTTWCQPNQLVLGERYRQLVTVGWVWPNMIVMDQSVSKSSWHYKQIGVHEKTSSIAFSEVLNEQVESCWPFHKAIWCYYETTLKTTIKFKTTTKRINLSSLTSIQNQMAMTLSELMVSGPWHTIKWWEIQDLQKAWGSGNLPNPLYGMLCQICLVSILQHDLSSHINLTLCSLLKWTTSIAGQ